MPVGEFCSIFYFILKTNFHQFKHLEMISP